MAHILLVGTLIQPFTHNEREYFRLQLAEVPTPVAPMVLEWFGEYVGFCEKHLGEILDELQKEGRTLLGWMEWDENGKLLKRKIHCRFCEEVPEKAERLYIELRR